MTPVEEKPENGIAVPGLLPNQPRRDPYNVPRVIDLSEEDVRAIRQPYAGDPPDHRISWRNPIAIALNKLTGCMVSLDAKGVLTIHRPGKLGERPLYCQRVLPNAVQQWWLTWRTGYPSKVLTFTINLPRWC